MNVSIDIDELVLHGVPVDDVPTLRRSLEAELTRLATGGPVPDQADSPAPDLGTRVAGEVWSRVSAAGGSP